MRHAVWALVACIAALCLSASVRAQSDVDRPTALIFTYRAHPGMRAQFRAVMQAEGVRQLEQWKEQHVFASYEALFTAFAGNNAPDMFLVVRFAHFHDLAKWEALEAAYPGGLPAKAQALADVESSGTADVVQDRTSTAAGGKDAQFFVLEYDVLVDSAKYESYVKGYVAPQFEKWVDAGVLASYATYVNQNPAGAPWTSFIVLEYKDLPSLAKREVVKAQARKELAASDAVWKKWSDDKTAIRKEKAAIPALNLKGR